MCILAPRELTCFFVPHDYQDETSDDESDEEEEDEVDSEDEARRQAEEDEREADRLFVQRMEEDVIARVNARFPGMLDRARAQAQALALRPPEEEEERGEEN